jgi:CRP/FNR family transcriptional regulator, cyclic AMP receptor protein
VAESNNRGVPTAIGTGTWQAAQVSRGFRWRLCVTAATGKLASPIETALERDHDLAADGTCAVKKGRKSSFDVKAFLANADGGGTVSTYEKGQIVFSQGDLADAVFYVQDGKVKVTVVSEKGKEAVVAVHGKGHFFGEGCLNGQPRRLATVAAMTESHILRLGKAVMVRTLHEEPTLADTFMTYLLARNARVEEDLVDQLFNSSEKRLARVLLLMATFGKEGTPEPVIPKISQETLAEMVGTTRSRVSVFMNKFRELGFVEYNGEMKVHSSLLSVVLHD